MANLPQQIITTLKAQKGLTDRQIADAIWGKSDAQQPVNQACRRLESRGVLSRKKRIDGLIGNYLVTTSQGILNPSSAAPSLPDPVSEDFLKQVLQNHLSSQGWQVQVAWGKSQGIDVEAVRGAERRVIEVKGRGSRPQMQVNFFLAVLGGILQKMNDPTSKYSIALPDLPAYRNLWTRLPDLAKTRTGITAIFVDNKGNVSEVS